MHTVSNLDSAPCSTTEPETWWFQTPFCIKEEIKVFKQQRWGHPPFLLFHSTESEIHGTMETRSKRESDAEKSVLVLFILSFNSLVPNAQPVPRTLDSSFFFSVRLKIGFRSFILKRGLPHDGPLTLAFLSTKWPHFNRRDEEWSYLSLPYSLWKDSYCQGIYSIQANKVLEPYFLILPISTTENKDGASCHCAFSNIQGFLTMLGVVRVLEVERETNCLHETS